MAQHGPSVTLSLTLPITCHICLGKVRHPVICVNNHVFCSICIEVWLKNNNQCPACRIPITPENPCKEIIGGTSESDAIFSPTVRKHLRKTRLELLHKEYEQQREDITYFWRKPVVGRRMKERKWILYTLNTGEDEIESLQKEVEDLKGKNLSLQIQLKSLLDPAASALSCQNGETSQSANKGSTSGPETPEEWSKKLKTANDMCEKLMDNVEKLREANKKLSVENNSLLRENLRLKAEVDSRSPQKFGRFTVAALHSKVEQSEREINRLKKALERSDKYIEEIECQLLQLKNAGKGSQTVSAVCERVLSTDAEGGESSEDTTCLKTQAEEKKSLNTSQSPDSLEQLTSGGTCLSSSSHNGLNSSNTPKKGLFPGCHRVLLDENSTNMDACLEDQWNKIEECTPYKDEELYDLPPPCTPFLSLSRLQLNTPDGKENARKPSTFLRKLKFEEFHDTSDDCSKDSSEHSTSSCNSRKKLNCFTTGKSGVWGTCPTNFAENLDFDGSEQNSVAGESDQTTAKSSDKTSSCLPKRLHTLCCSEMNRTRTSSEASMDAAYLDKISELDSMMSESDNSKSPCYNFKSSDLEGSSKSTECTKLLNGTEKNLEEMNEEQSMKSPETSDLAADRTGWKPAMFSNLSPSDLDMNDHFPLFTGQNVVANDAKPPNSLFQRDFSPDVLFSNSQRLFEEQKFSSCFLKMPSDLQGQIPPWVSSFTAERKNKNVSQSTKRKIQNSLSSASPSKTTKN
ncbi:ORC ubiquitin ligase 1 isoform X1 [Corvus hawaiiensis]|uniref:ORC ubiquitin ligase 1 isoform X1 n=1 Tax=Corvus hawaiiensis TaxID=134902 RepID=UPI0020189164|nr:ORC ubiquitin ligase 1 isoform X1 [Corvus hawaiiensis]